MNTPKPKQLTQRNPKQRDVVPLKYMLRIDRRKCYPRLPRIMLRKYAPGGLRIHEEGHKEDK